MTKPRKRFQRSAGLREFQNEFNQWKINHSKLPEHAVPKSRFRDDSESELKKCIRAYCKMNGWLFTSYDAKGFYNPRTKRWQRSKNDTGRGDGIIEIPIEINGMRLSKTVWVDIKIGRDYQKKHQRIFQHQAERANASYIMPKSFDHFIELINELKNEINI